jgi:two-component system, sensor histidine kinase LadS
MSFEDNVINAGALLNRSLPFSKHTPKYPLAPHSLHTPYHANILLGFFPSESRFMRKVAIFITAATVILLIFMARDSSGTSYHIPLEVLRDPGAVLTLEEVISASDKGTLPFTRVSGQGYTGGYSRDVLWFKFEIRPLSPAAPVLFLEIQPPYLDDIQLFFPDSQGQFQKISTGDIYPFSERLVPYRSPVISLANPVTSFTAYIRLQTTSTSAMFLKAWTPGEFYASSLREYMVIGAYVGILLLFILGNMSRREWRAQSGIAYYVIYIFGILLVVLSSGGLLSQFVWPDQPWLDQLMTPASTLGMVAATTLYYGHLFGVSRGDSKLLIVIRRFMVALVIAGFVAITLNRYVEFVPYFLAISTGIGLLLAAKSTKMLKIHAEESRWLIAGWCASLTGFTITGLTTIGVLPGYPILLNAYHFSTVATIFNYQILMNLRIARLANAEQLAKIEALNANERLLSEQRVSELQSRFLAMIHHELRTPLSIIRLALGMKNASPKIKMHASDAVRNIDTILERCALSQRLEHAQITPNFKNVDVPSLLTLMISKLAEHERIVLELRPAGGSYMISTDPDFLVIMLRNLLENAFKYAVENSLVEITVTGKSDLHELCITITNQVEHPEEIDTVKIFERYVRTPSATRLSGSGLGLYIAKGLADSLRAEMDCYLDKNKINFRVCF